MGRKFLAKDKILVHLLNYQDIKGEYTQPVEVTQGGLAKRLGLQQSTVSYALQDLVEEGLVTEETRRIEGKRQKRKAYHLTDKGLEKAKDTRDEMSDSPVTVEMIGGEREITLGNVSKYFQQSLSLTDLLKRVEDGHLNLNQEDKEKAYVTHAPGLPVKDFTVSLTQQFQRWWMKGREPFLLVGPAGSGKTTYLHSLIESVREETNIFYFKAEGWHTRIYYWRELSDFLDGIGKHRLSAYIEAVDWIDVETAVKNLKRDLNYKPVVFILDDAHLNMQVADEFMFMAKKLTELTNLRFVFTRDSVKKETDREDTDMTHFELETEGSETMLFWSISQHFNIETEGSLDDLLRTLAVTKLTFQEMMVLGYLSVFREPVEKRRLKNTSPREISTKAIDMLVVSPLVDRTAKDGLFVHPSVRHWRLSRMSSRVKRNMHQVAARYYAKETSKDIEEMLEELFHLAKVGDNDTFVERVEENGRDIIDSGYGETLGSVIGLVLEKEQGLSSEDREELFYKEAEARQNSFDLSGARDLYHDIIDETNNTERRVKARLGLAKTLEKEGKYKSAVTQYEDAKAELKEGPVSSREGLLGVVHLRLGEVWEKIGEYEKAMENLRQAIDFLIEEEDEYLLTSSYFILARLERGEGNLQDSLEPFKMGLKHWNELEEKNRDTEGLRGTGSLYRVLKELEYDGEYLDRPIDESKTLGYWRLKSSAYLALAECHMENGDYDRAIKVGEQANEVLSKLDRKEDQAFTYALLGKAYMETGIMERAEESLNKAITLYQGLGLSFELGISYFSMAKLKEKKQDRQGTAENYRKAALCFSDIGTNWMAERISNEMKRYPMTY